MSPLVKALLKKKARRNRLGHNIDELKDKIGQIITQNRRAPASGKLGSRALWRKVDQLFHRRDKSATNLDQKFIEGLNDYFGELCFDNNYIRPTPVTIENNMPLPQFSSAQVYHALSGIKRTATGPDGIPFWVWKEHAAIFTPVVEVLWNKSMAHQSWPKRWKEANINPQAKIDIPSEYADYRGISVTPVIARAFERTVYCTFNKNCSENFISDSQFAYRSGGSCLNALLKIQNGYLKALDNKNT